MPLIVRWPTRLPAGTHVDSFVQQLDYAPTLLRWANAEPLSFVDGKDFGALAEGTDATPLWDRIVCCENTWQSKWAVRTQQHKLIVARAPDHHGMPARELYDLSRDTDETHNLIEESPAIAEELEQWLDNWIADGLKRAGRTEDPLRVQPLTLGKRWDEWLKRAQHT